MDDEVILDIGITGLGFDPPFSSFNIGYPPNAAGDAAPLPHFTTLGVRITNVDVWEHAIRMNTNQSTKAAGVNAATAAESGLLAPGESYIVEIQVGPDGVIDLSDPTDPALQGTVQLVEGNGPGNPLFLPFIQR